MYRGRYKARATRAACECLEPRTLLSVSVVKDTTIAPFDQDLSDSTLVKLHDQVLFVAHDPATGNELWRTDGTAGGTALVKDIVPGPVGSEPMGLVGNGSVAYFTTADAGTGLRLWKTDGTTASTTPIATIGSATQTPTDEAIAGGDAYYVVASSATDTKPTLTLWRSDGTAAGTVALKKADAVNGQIASLTPVGNRLFFEIYNRSSGDALWETDGTAAGTALVKSLAVAAPRPTAGAGRDLLAPVTPAFQQVLRTMAGVGGELFFGTGGTAGGGLWKTDGTPAGTVQIQSFQPVAGDVQFGYVAEFHGDAIFQFQDRPGLFKSDGTPAGTVVIATLPREQSVPAVPAVVSGGVFYVASDDGSRLWKSDGTPGGTAVVGHFAKQSISFATVVGGRLLFFAADLSSLREGLYSTDGTPAGTQVVAPVSVVSPQKRLGDVIAVEDELFFRNSDPQSGVELWKSDGTADGTKLIRDIDISGVGFEFGQTVAVGSTAYFLSPLDQQSHAAFWRSDGTDAGTVPVKSFTFTNGAAASGLSDLIAVGSRLYFVAYDAGKQQSVLFASDGTATGTVALAQPAGAANQMLSNLTAAGDSLFFEVLGSDGTDQLWRSTANTAAATGRAAGPVFDGSRFGDSGHVLGDFTAVGSTLYFTLLHSGESDLWKVDGATGQVSLVYNLSASNLANFNGTLVFNGNDGTGVKLWRSDGTYSGTQPIADVRMNVPANGPLILPVGNVFYFAGFRPDSGVQLWESDGTASGTMLLTTVSGGGAGPARLTAAGNTVFFTVQDAATGHEAIWKSDGTSAGTVPIVPDRGALPANADIAAFHGTLYFAANLDSNAGAELYRTDATAAGIVLVKDIFPGPGNSSPFDFVATDKTLFFDVVDDGLRHQATWKLDDTPVSISGRVFDDVNRDGIAEANDPGLAHWTVYLDAKQSGTLGTGEISTTTDITGHYEFAGLAPGTYTVRQVVQAGYRSTTSAGVTVTGGPSTVPAAGPVFGDAPVSAFHLDFNYLLILAQHFNGPGTILSGDLNGDNKVDFADLLLLAQNYGHALPGAAADKPARASG